MHLPKLFRNLLLALGLGLTAASAQADPTLDFVFDAAGSSVTLTDQGQGFICFISNCGVEANLASGFGSSPVTVGTGDIINFDFLTFTGNGTGGAIYDIAATLAFTAPADASTTGTGGGSVLLLGGNITGGFLNWDNLPLTILLNQGSTVTIDFQDGLTLLAGNSVTSSASITGVNVVPLPATVLLLGLGMLAAGYVGTRRRAQHS